MELTHFDAAGRAHMVNVTDKQDTDRVAVAAGRVVMAAETLSRIGGWDRPVPSAGRGITSCR